MWERSAPFAKNAKCSIQDVPVELTARHSRLENRNHVAPAIPVRDSVTAIQ